MCGFPHAAEQRPLRAAGVPGQDHSDHLKRHHREHHVQPDVEADGDPSVGEGQEHQGCQGTHDDHVGSDSEKRPVRIGRDKIFLLDQFSAIGECLEPAELASDPGGAEPVLDSARDLALGPDEDARWQAKEAGNQCDVDHRGQKHGPAFGEHVPLFESGLDRRGGFGQRRDHHGIQIPGVLPG